MKRLAAWWGTTVVLLVMPAALPAQALDSALARLERMVVANDRPAARGLADSLLSAMTDSPRIADVLYWRAATASNAADAERDYLRVAIEHPFSPRTPDALLALAQLEFARGDRAAARRRFDRLLRDYPTGRHVARASFWSGRLAIEDRDVAVGCATMNAGRSQVASADVELANQFDYYLGQCARFSTAPADTAATPPETAKGTPVPGPQFSVQVAAYGTQRDATALANRLKARGFEVRVANVPGGRVPWRVRIGRYGTRADATAALRRVRGAGLSGIVVEAEPR